MIALNGAQALKRPSSRRPNALCKRPLPKGSCLISSARGRDTFLVLPIPHQLCFLSRSEEALQRTCAAPRSVGASLEEMIALDGLIDSLMAAQSQEELAKVVADNFLALDQKFWMRIASRSDSASSQMEKDRLASRASEVMRIVEALVKQSDSQIMDSASILTKIVAAAADAKGEWQLPLSDEQLAAMKEEMERNSSYLDESLLATANAWMRKASTDKLDGTVLLLQHVLQLYAGRALTLPYSSENADDEILDDILASRESVWVQKLQNYAESGKTNQTSFLTALQRKMEQTVIALPSGSNAQKIQRSSGLAIRIRMRGKTLQAEYLKEVELRAEAYFKQGP